MKPTGAKQKLIIWLLATLIVTVSFSLSATQVFAQETEEEPEYFMGIQILESVQQKILESIHAVKELKLGNMIILNPYDQGWDLILIEQAIREAENLGLYISFEAFNFSDHAIKISPEKFSEWQGKYPHLLGILVQEVTGKQIDMKLWENNATGTIKTRLEAEEAIIGNITDSMLLKEFKENGARILLQENVVSYVSANTSYCDVLITKCFNTPNTELMIGLTRGITKSYEISAWGLWVDTWREWIIPPAFTPNDVERALYEGWFYGAKYFFFEQGNFFGTLNREWDNKFIILNENGTLSEYGKILQTFYTFLQNQKHLEYDQPDHSSDIAIMIGQSGWAGRGKDWGFWNQSDRQGDFDYNLLNIFFPGIGDNWQIGQARIEKEFTGLPFGMSDLISIYAPPSVLKQYKVIIALGWSQMSQSIADNIEDYVEGGGTFFSLLSFSHNSESIDDLEDPYAWTKGYADLFGIEVIPVSENGLEIREDALMHNITFTEDTFWNKWSGKVYRYSGDDNWLWKYKYRLSKSENTTVIAWVDGIQTTYNAFIIENRKGAGYTYTVNTRNPNSLPNEVYTNVLSDFVYSLCAHYVKPLTFVIYPQNEYWLDQGQANRTVYLNHDNSTTTQQFTYQVSEWQTDLKRNQNYLVTEYFSKESYGVVNGAEVNLDLALATNEAKLFILFEDNDKPKVLFSDAVFSNPPMFSDNHLTLAFTGLEETSNITTIYCSELGMPQYILGVPFDMTQDYDKETKMLEITSDSDVIVGWEPTTNISVASSTFALTQASWNQSLGTLDLTAKGVIGQQTSIQVQTNGKKPYYMKIDGKETSDWSYNETTSSLTTNFLLGSDDTDLIFGFKPIMIDQAVVSDKRADVGSVQTISFHVAWMNNGSDIEGATVFVNGTEYVTNMTGWASFETSHYSVGKLFWNATEVRFVGLKDFAKVYANPIIIWDRIKVTDSVVIEGLIQSGSLQNVWLTAEYEYDSAIFDNTDDMIYLNNEPMKWSSQNMRWEKNVTSDILGPIKYEVTAVEESKYSLHVVNQEKTTEITWDKIDIVKTTYHTNKFGVTNISILVEFAHNKSHVDSAMVFVNGNQCKEIEQGIFLYTVEDWSPIQNYAIEVYAPNFEKTTKTVSTLQTANTTLYILIGLVAGLIATLFVLKRKKE
jgi:hypothetical protein